MKTIKDPLSVERVGDIKFDKRVIIYVLLLVAVPVIVGISNICESFHEKKVYDDLDITLKKVEAVDYGTADYDLMDLVDNVPTGAVVDYKESLDTKTVGVQEVTFEIIKDGVVKEVTTEIEVVDKEKPDVSVSKEKLSIYKGDSFDPKSNITLVRDQADGDLNYVSNDQVKDGEWSYYTVSSNVDTNSVGDYSVSVKAVDSSGNVTEKEYTVSVEAKPQPRVYTNNYVTNNNAKASVDTSSVVSAANSFIGYNYTPGGASPATGFDCSGFVYYIYGLFGKRVGRSTGDLLYSGTGVSRNNMQAGDIILWSSNGSTPTHAALYVGGGMMIHAANSQDGVISSSVEYWDRYAGDIISVRRV